MDRNIKIVFGCGVCVPDINLDIMAVSGNTPLPVKCTTIRLDLCRWHTSGFE